MLQFVLSATSVLWV